MVKRFQRPLSEYSGAVDLQYTDKYQQDSKAIPKIAISSSKMDGDFNYLVDAVNTLDEDIKSVVASGIANESVQSKHLAPSCITEDKLTDEIVSSSNLKDASVTNTKIGDLSVTTTKIANNSVTKDKMGTASVGTDELVDASITRDKLAEDAISDSVPVGTIAQFCVDLLPTGWILCNGAELSKNTYPQLVTFLTNSDTILTATLPDLNTDESALAQYAIKAFSDTIELATLDIAGLTQDVANNTADILQMEHIASGSVIWDGTLESPYNISMVTKLSTGQYKVYLEDDFIDIDCEVILTPRSTSWYVLSSRDVTTASFEISSVRPDTSYTDGTFDFRVYKRRES